MILHPPNRDAVEVHIKFTYAPDKHVELPLGSGLREYSEVILGAFTAHVKLKQFWAVFITVLGGFIVTLGMVLIGHISPTAALDFVGFLCGSLIVQYHIYGKSHDKINALMHAEKE